MKNYKKMILNHLVDKYEKSSLYRGDNKVNVTIGMTINKKNLSDYFNEWDYTLKKEINEQALSLQEEALIEIQWKKFQEGNILDKLKLNIESLDRVYEVLKRQPKSQLENDVGTIVMGYCDRTDWLGDFARDMKEKLVQKGSIKKYLDIEDRVEVKDVFMALDQIRAQTDEIPKRVFSIRVFSDSKRFERVESKVVRIMRDYGPYEVDMDILAEENIIQNPSYVFLKGKAVLLCNEETINLEKVDGEIGLGAGLIDNLSFKTIDAKRVLTIENLTTFHCYEPKDELVIYLGGYHNATRRRLLKKIHGFNPDLAFYHWGDIDLGGFRILNHLRNKTGINVKSYRMDRETLEMYKNHTKKIKSEQYSGELTKLLENEEYIEFHEVIRYMIENNMILEQEALDIG
ncbi:conserved hypothetical protein [Alkaliphilus metalliredigens QYMF]|uniref:Wadjet protein JetD C-terminal domain-containing protein n=1 Tax=Alkaliphilus metalliredigens (strain QYMF) TaxID=293826 RepID=A6TQ44_ALKMQ|nr:Wadjet anti-phage system protein JetD domain-containing protein [Alkaliphilus metalliredigens]ABR48312.1 conserved hypothetical protein [Alkaliphilus metalliredigens QYMF]